MSLDFTFFLAIVFHKMHDLINKVVSHRWIHFLDVDGMVDVLYEINVYFKVIIKVLLADETKVSVGGEAERIRLTFWFLWIDNLKGFASFDFLLEACFVVVIKFNKVCLV